MMRSDVFHYYKYKLKNDPIIMRYYSSIISYIAYDIFQTKLGTLTSNSKLQ